MTSLRESMPQVAAWIDELREAFGTEAIDRSIRAGLRGEVGFIASENGQVVGTPFPKARYEVHPSQMVLINKHEEKDGKNRRR